MSQGPGVTFMASLAEAADSLGIPVELECAGKKLIMKDGKVAGVLAVKKDGTVVEYDAPVVIIATGGYASNEDFLFAVSENRHRTIMQQGGPGRDGDGIKMAHEAGADMTQGLGTIMWVAPVIDGATWTSLGYSASVQLVLWINQDCKRFINEDRWLSDFSAVGTALANQERTFTVFTQADLDYWEETGPYGTVFSFCPVGTPMTGVKDYLDELGTVSKCETMEDLVAEAANRGLDADAFKSIIEEYNGYCADGRDARFEKDPQYLHAIDEGPFYIAETQISITTNVGGLKVTPSCEVVDTDGGVINGLYAGGNDAGGLYGDSYDVSYAPGSQASWACNSGRLAAKAAQKYLGK